MAKVINIKLEIEKAKVIHDKAVNAYLRKLDKLRKMCDHEFETFRSYDRSDSSCKICGVWSP